MATPPPTKRFLLCFNPKDADGKAELLAHLAPARGSVSIWSVDEVPAGASVQATFQEAAAGADAALLLLSADFFAELDDPRFAEQVNELRRQNQARKLRLIPIIWRHCDWGAVDWLAKLKPMPAEGLAIASLDKAQRDIGWTEIARQLDDRARPIVRGLAGAIRPSAQVVMPDRATLIAKSKNLLATSEADFEHAIDVELGIEQVPQLVRAQHVPHAGARGTVEARPLEEGLLDYVLRMERLLLIGQPGAGKTQTLRTLCGELLAVAEQDPGLGVPFLVNFSTFSTYQGPLSDWLAEGLKEGTGIPLAVGQELLRQGQALLLLDGLDEMAAERRAGALTELNVLLKAADPALARCVVCSRTLEYAEAGVPLLLPAALELQPLNPSQVQAAIAQAGAPAAPLSAAMEKDQELANLLQTPLLLAIAVRSFAGTPDLALAGRAPTELRQLLYDAYVLQMLRRTSGNAGPASLMLRWLRWLAQHLTRERSSVFLLERLQPAVLSSERAYRIVAGLLRGLLAGLLFGLGVWILAEVGIKLGGMGPDAKPGDGQFPGLIAGLGVGLGVGVGMDLAYGLVYGLAFGLVSGLVYTSIVVRLSEVSASGNLPKILTGILAIGLVCVILVGLPVGLVGRLNAKKVEAVEQLRWSLAQASRFWKSHLIMSLAAGLCMSLAVIVSGKPANASYAIGIGMVLGIVTGLVHFAVKGWSKAVHTQSTQPNEGIRASVRNGVQQAATVALGVAATALLGAVLLATPISGAGTALVVAIGIGIGLPVGLGSGVGEALKHYILRAFLWRQGKLPLRLVPWLESCRASLLLRRQGGAYLFWHVTLQNYFAELDDTRLADVAKRIESRPAYVQRY